MEGFMIRLIEEKRQLDKRIDKLTSLINPILQGKRPVGDFPGAEKELELLDRQLMSMEAYSCVLGERIAHNEPYFNSFETVAQAPVTASTPDRATLIVEVLQLSQAACSLQFSPDLAAMASDRIKAILLKL